MYSIIIRILLFLDQLHDFNEAEDRNQLFSKCSPFTNKEEIYERIKQLCINDINYIYEQFGYKDDVNIKKNFGGVNISDKYTFIKYYENILDNANKKKDNKYEFIVGQEEKKRERRERRERRDRRSKKKERRRKKKERRRKKKERTRKKRERGK